MTDKLGSKHSVYADFKLHSSKRIKETGDPYQLFDKKAVPAFMLRIARIKQGLYYIGHWDGERWIAAPTNSKRYIKAIEDLESPYAGKPFAEGR